MINSALRPAVFGMFLSLLALSTALFPSPTIAADRARIEAFLEVTGFDVALDSIALSASGAPEMLGMNTSDFGSQWSRLANEVFDTDGMRNLALEILEKTLDDDALDHAAEFYASDLGQRLVRAENASHMIEDDLVREEAGYRIVSDLVRAGSQRVTQYKRMEGVLDSTGNWVRAVQEVQFRFLMAAATAGVIELEADADELRALLDAQEGELRLSLQASGLASNAYTYQGFTDEEVETYIEALEKPQMQRVYELFNAVQFEITANRFEELAHRMADLMPGQDI
jgi:hypothetical protein